MVGKKAKEVEYEIIPRLVLKLRLDPDKYPSKDPPEIEISGFFKHREELILKKLRERFEPGFGCIFDFYLYAKDEMFVDPNNPYNYSPEFFKNEQTAEGKEGETKEEDYLIVANSQQCEELKDELLETMKLRSITEPVCCPICYTEFNFWDKDTMDSIWIFRECLHVFCKPCIAEVASKSIDNGQLDRVTCPTTISNNKGQRLCTTYITDNDLKKIGVTVDRIDKVTKFSICQAIEKMEDMGWCPREGCGEPADINQEMNWGTCTGCKFRFCT